MIQKSKRRKIMKLKNNGMWYEANMKNENSNIIIINKDGNFWERKISNNFFSFKNYKYDIRKLY